VGCDLTPFLGFHQEIRAGTILPPPSCPVCHSSLNRVIWKWENLLVFAGRRRAMSAFDDHKDELQHYEQMLGAHRGRLAVTLDRVTNAMVLVGQHGVYCHSQRDPTKPTMDIQIITEELRKAKELIQSVMEDLRVERENRLRAN
jgi:hypothetical protein